MKISVKCPTRVDLAGGTLDLWPLYLFVDEALTINLSIDIFTQVNLTILEDSSEVQVHISNLDFKKTYKNIDEFHGSKDSEVSLVSAVTRHFKPKSGFSIETFSESPVGGGLGGSSSLCISLIKAFLKWSGESMTVNQMVRLASNLEAKVLKTPTGCQDHYAPASPGLNFIYLKNTGPDFETIEIDEQVFSERMFLIYTGKPHHSGINNWQVYKSVIDGDEKTLALLEDIKNITLELKDVLLNKDWDSIPNLFNREYEARVKLSPGFSSPEIESLHKLVLQNKGKSVKICGAGGGGCVLVWTDPQHKQQVIEACEQQGYKVLKASPFLKDQS